ncbi:MAG: M28 family peptidase [Smithella sp.]
MDDIRITPVDVKETLGLTAKVIDECGARLTGSESCKKAANIVMDEMKKHCDSVKIEEFDVHPESFLGFFKAIVIIYILSSFLLYFGYIYVGAAGYLLGLFMMLSQSIFYWELFDPFYRKVKGYNVFGTIEPEGEVKQQIILSGHHDTAYEFRFLAHHQKLYSVRLILAMVTAAAVLVFSLIRVYYKFTTGADPAFGAYMRYGVFAGLIFIAPLYFFISEKGTPGAGDNMIATAIVIKLAELFKKAQGREGHLLRNTRLVFLSVDAEEAGLRGARAFAKRHKKELLNIPAYNFNIDSIYNLNELQFITRDINSTVNLSKKMAVECKEIADKLGYPARLFAVTPGGGGTDAAEFARIGVEATSIIGMPTNMIRDGMVYHTLNDTVEHIEPAAVEATLKIALAYILKKEQNGFAVQ